MKIAIVTCCTSNWLPFALATHHSVSRNLSLAVDHFAITNEKELPEARALLAKFTSHYGVPIRHEYLKDEHFEGCHVGICTASSLYRLKLPQMLPADYDRVLYLDSDLLVLKPIDDMLQMDMGGMPVAAVDDIWVNMSTHQVATDIRQAIGFSANNVYFNSGVLLLDWKKTVSDKLMEQALAILRQHNLHIADQCALNSVVRDGWKAMPLEYNWINRVDDCLRTDPVIRHFSESGKPWSDNLRRKDTAYRKFYSDFLVSLGLAPLPPTGLATYLRQVGVAYHGLRKRFRRWRKNRPDEIRQVREYVRLKVDRLPNNR